MSKNFSNISSGDQNLKKRSCPVKNIKKEGKKKRRENDYVSIVTKNMKKVTNARIRSFINWRSLLQSLKKNKNGRQMILKKKTWVDRLYP